jgi:hypothetical protein
LRYANNSNYKNDTVIKKEVFVSQAALDELKRIIGDSEVRWAPRPRLCGPGAAWRCFHSAMMYHLPATRARTEAKRTRPGPLHAQIMKEADNNWPTADRVGRQELEVVMGNEHVSFNTTKLGSVLQVQQSKDPEGLRIFYYLVQVGDSVGWLVRSTKLRPGRCEACGAAAGFVWAGFQSPLHRLQHPSCWHRRRLARPLQGGPSSAECSKMHCSFDLICSGCEQRYPQAGAYTMIISHALPPQDLKCFVFSLISAHFKIQPIQK